MTAAPVSPKPIDPALELAARMRAAVRLRTQVAIVAIALLAVSASLYTFMIVSFATDAPSAEWLTTPLPVWGRPGGLRFLPAAIAFSIPLGFIFIGGAWLLVTLDLVRRQTRRRAPVDKLGPMLSGVLRLRVRPLSPRVHGAWAAGFAALYGVGYALQFTFGLLTPNALAEITHPLELHLLLMLPGLGAAGLAAAMLVSLLRKLNYLWSHAVTNGTMRVSRMRRLPQKLPADHYFAAFGGVLLGSAVWPLTTDDLFVAQLLAVVGVVLLGVGVALALSAVVSD